ncbi:amidohydrolase [Vibrio algarum]|uniref:Amidohydrolase n=1 Tax=Vibrio algarum TaxID=3020714 RepID=A0ABT4YNY4_9VIBR|nr:amidohydrolase [Vibrio sp. KJ40-1]MDB1123213.1 amidohydrolase [Vibrio sp. KJ40-1]
MDATLNTLCFDPIEFRKQLHRQPELSVQEKQTSAMIFSQLENFGLSPTGHIGGYGIICIVDSGYDGETTLFRADFDALPINEIATHDHVSENVGVMHACGHDGHTSSLLMVAEQLSKSPPKTGKVILLFQPAEETGTGALSMLNDKALSSLKVDNVFAYHNLPGYPLNQILIREGTFACASTGISIEFEGKTSHAARPENGLSPCLAMIETVNYLQSIPNMHPDVFSLVTIVHARLGEEAFGIAPGNAKVMATMRSDCNQTFSNMKSNLLAMLDKLQQKTGIIVKVDWDEPFNAAFNSSKHCQIINQQAKQLGFTVESLNEPMRWSEDFSEFLLKWNGALFCIGSGNSHPELHNPDYDFPDEILKTASQLFISIVDQLHSN